MSQQEARDEISQVIRRHAGDLDSDDLRDIAEGLESIAEKWEVASL